MERDDSHPLSGAAKLDNNNEVAASIETIEAAQWPEQHVGATPDGEASVSVAYQNTRSTSGAGKSRPPKTQHDASDVSKSTGTNSKQEKQHPLLGSKKHPSRTSQKKAGPLDTNSNSKRDVVTSNLSKVISKADYDENDEGVSDGPFPSRSGAFGTKNPSSNQDSATRVLSSDHSNHHFQNEGDNSHLGLARDNNDDSEYGDVPFPTRGSGESPSRSVPKSKKTESASPPPNAAKSGVVDSYEHQYPQEPSRKFAQNKSEMIEAELEQEQYQRHQQNQAQDKAKHIPYEPPPSHAPRAFQEDHRGTDWDHENPPLDSNRNSNKAQRHIPYEPPPSHAPRAFQEDHRGTERDHENPPLLDSNRTVDAKSLIHESGIGAVRGEQEDASHPSTDGDHDSSDAIGSHSKPSGHQHHQKKTLRKKASVSASRSNVFGTNSASATASPYTAPPPLPSSSGVGGKLRSSSSQIFSASTQKLNSRSGLRTSSSEIFEDSSSSSSKKNVSLKKGSKVSQSQLIDSNNYSESLHKKAPAAGVGSDSDHDNDFGSRAAGETPSKGMRKSSSSSHYDRQSNFNINEGWNNNNDIAPVAELDLVNESSLQENDSTRYDSQQHQKQQQQHQQQHKLRRQQSQSSTHIKGHGKLSRQPSMQKMPEENRGGRMSRQGSVLKMPQDGIENVANIDFASLGFGDATDRDESDSFAGINDDGYSGIGKNRFAIRESMDKLHQPHNRLASEEETSSRPRVFNVGDVGAIVAKEGQRQMKKHKSMSKIHAARQEAAKAEAAAAAAAAAAETSAALATAGSQHHRKARQSVSTMESSKMNSEPTSIIHNLLARTKSQSQTWNHDSSNVVGSNNDSSIIGSSLGGVEAGSNFGNSIFDDFPPLLDPAAEMIAEEDPALESPKVSSSAMKDNHRDSNKTAAAHDLAMKGISSDEKPSGHSEQLRLLDQVLKPLQSRLSISHSTNPSGDAPIVPTATLSSSIVSHKLPAPTFGMLDEAEGEEDEFGISITGSRVATAESSAAALPLSRSAVTAAPSSTQKAEPFLKKKSTTHDVHEKRINEHQKPLNPVSDADHPPFPARGFEVESHKDIQRDNAIIDSSFSSSTTTTVAATPVTVAGTNATKQLLSTSGNATSESNNAQVHAPSAVRDLFYDDDLYSFSDSTARERNNLTEAPVIAAAAAALEKLSQKQKSKEEIRPTTTDSLAAEPISELQPEDNPSPFPRRDGTPGEGMMSYDNSYDDQGNAFVETEDEYDEFGGRVFPDRRNLNAAGTYYESESEASSGHTLQKRTSKSHKSTVGHASENHKSKSNHHQPQSRKKITAGKESSSDMVPLQMAFREVTKAEMQNMEEKFPLREDSVATDTPPLKHSRYSASRQGSTSSLGSQANIQHGMPSSTASSRDDVRLKESPSKRHQSMRDVRQMVDSAGADSDASSVSSSTPRKHSKESRRASHSSVMKTSSRGSSSTSQVGTNVNALLEAHGISGLLPNTDELKSKRKHQRRQSHRQHEKHQPEVPGSAARKDTMPMLMQDDNSAVDADGMPVERPGRALDEETEEEDEEDEHIIKYSSVSDMFRNERHKVAQTLKDKEALTIELQKVKTENEKLKKLTGDVSAQLESLQEKRKHNEKRLKAAYLKEKEKAQELETQVNLLQATLESTKSELEKEKSMVLKLSEESDELAVVRKDRDETQHRLESFQEDLAHYKDELERLRLGQPEAQNMWEVRKALEAEVERLEADNDLKAKKIELDEDMIKAMTEFQNELKSDLGSTREQLDFMRSEVLRVVNEFLRGDLISSQGNHGPLDGDDRKSAADAAARALLSHSSGSHGEPQKTDGQKDKDASDADGNLISRPSSALGEARDKNDLSSDHHPRLEPGSVTTDDEDSQIEGFRNIVLQRMKTLRDKLTAERERVAQLTSEREEILKMLASSNAELQKRQEELKEMQETYGSQASQVQMARSEIQVLRQALSELRENYNRTDVEMKALSGDPEVLAEVRNTVEKYKSFEKDYKVLFKSLEKARSSGMVVLFTRHGFVETSLRELQREMAQAKSNESGYASKKASSNDDAVPHDTTAAAEMPSIRGSKMKMNVNLNEQSLPEGWTRGLSRAGKIYYVDHKNKRTQWHFPVVPKAEPTTTQEHDHQLEQEAVEEAVMSRAVADIRSNAEIFAT